jgi:hypothetical protein
MRMRRASVLAAIAALSWIVMHGASGAMGASGAPVLELRTFADHADPRSRGISVVVINNSAREIAVWTGYDGERNRLVSAGAGFPIALYPAVKKPPQRVMVAPGMAETLYTLSMDAIFYLRPGAQRKDWRWAWKMPAPRGAPPPSPFHANDGLGWEVRRAPSAAVAALGEMDGAVVESKPVELRITPPRFATVKVLAGFTTGRENSTDDARYYDMVFKTLKTYEGTLTAAEHVLRLEAGYAERLMRIAGAQQGAAYNQYVFNGPPLVLTFARIEAGEQDAGRLILIAYEAVSKPGAP